MNRIKWIDYAKAFAIYAVLVIHTHCDVGITKICNAIALPLFFFISGYLFSFERHKTFRPFLYKRFRQLIIPYLWINTVAYLFWITIGRHFGEDAASGLAWYEPLVGIALGIGPKLAHDIPLWSLLSFFVVEMAYYWGYRILRSNRVLLIFFLMISWLMGVYHEYTSALPLTLGPTMSGLFFYTLGHSFKSINLLTKLSTHLNTIAIAAILGIFVLIAEINSKVNFYICQYSNFILFVLAALFGIAGIIMLSIKIGKGLVNAKLSALYPLAHF